MVITHTPGTIRSFLSGVPYHANILSMAVLTPPILLIMRELLKNQDENMDIENEREPEVRKKIGISILAFHTRVIFYIYQQGNQHAKESFNISWVRI